MQTAMETSKGNKKARPKGSVFSVKQKVEELPGAPSLVGRIVEKGFSPNDSPSSPAPLPQPTVLPFPVARHRSHGPHWNPATAARDAGEDDMEVDRDETDFDPAAVFANPIERKQKKGLDFSRWMELVAEEDDAPPRSKKREARAAPADGRETYNSGKKEGKAGTLPSNTSSDISLLAPDEDNSDLSTRDSHLSRLNRDEQKPILENMVYDASPFRDPSSQLLIQDTKFKASKSDVGEPVSLMDEVDAENAARLGKMSPDEIAEAQAEIMEKMAPSIVEMLKKRGQDKLGKKEGAKTEWGEESGHGAPVRTGETSWTIPENSLPSGAHVSLSWKVWSDRVEKVRMYRFSLEGNVLDLGTPREQQDGAKIPCGQYCAENVAERDFLRTEGDPAAVGYTINEAVALIRSMVPGQRVLALHMLASILNKASQNFKKISVSPTAKDTDNTDKIVDWPAVWSYALGPEPHIALSLRIALDDNHDSVVLACAKVIQSLLSCDMNETFFDNLEKVTTLGKDMCTAPIFRSRPDLDEGFLHGGFWKYNIKPSNIFPPVAGYGVGESEGKHTIHDDVVVAEQDVAAGFIRMGLLPRICYLLEMDPLPNLEDCLVSILVALARHSPQSADAILRCPRLIQTVVKMFTGQGAVEIHPSRIKAVILLKVLSKYDKRTCLEFVKNGAFQQAMWHWYRKPSTLEQWMKSGREHCRLTSAMMVEQLRLWKVCINHGVCIACFLDFFPVMCMWLGIPTFEKLIENNLLIEFCSISTESYLVLEALSRRLPVLHSVGQLDDYARAWSWSYVLPIINLATNWLALKDIPYISSLIGGENKTAKHVEHAPLASLLWVISAVLHMFGCLLGRIAPDNMNSENQNNTHLPWLPEFVPKIGLELIKNRFFDISLNSSVKHESPDSGGSFVRSVCYLRHRDDVDASLPSINCLHGLILAVLSIDKVVQKAKMTSCAESLDGRTPGTASKILEEGISKRVQNDMEEVLTMSATMVSSEWPMLLSAEMFGRGGPAPGVGVGWGSRGTSFWSHKYLLAQLASQLVLDLINIFPPVPVDRPIFEKSMKPEITKYLERINSILQICLIAGPGSRAVLEKATGFLFQVRVVKFLHLFVQYFVCHTVGLKSFQWSTDETDYLRISNMLNSHFRTRWLGRKSKFSANETKKSDALDTIDEESELPEAVDSSCDSMLIEWGRQRLPLPAHWFLSAICSIANPKSTSTYPPTDILDVASSGLFFLLGLEATSSFLRLVPSNCPVSAVPLAWKLHSLSMALHANMNVLEEEKSRVLFEVLQQLYGRQIDQLFCGYTGCLPKTNAEILDFQAQIHESYTTFVENLVEQFAAISYGDIVYGRQVAVYLHRSVDPTVRLAAWNALSNASVPELVPPLDKCIGLAEGYLEPVEDNGGILEAYAKSWISGALDRAAARESMAFTLAVHHLSCFIFQTNAGGEALRNKLTKSLIRSYLQKQQNEVMLRRFLLHGLTTSDEPLYRDEIGRRFEVLRDACEGNSSLLAGVEKLRSSGIN